MNRRHRRSHNPLRVESLAGWIFADLLLVLFIVGLGSQISLVSAAEPEPEPTKTEQPAPEPRELGMQQTAEIRTITVDAAALLGGSPEAQAAVDAQIQQVAADLAGRRAGLTLVWGYAGTADRGQAIARAVSERMATAAPDLFADHVPRALWQGSATEGTVEFEIYLFN